MTNHTDPSHDDIVSHPAFAAFTPATREAIARTVVSTRCPDCGLSTATSPWRADGLCRDCVPTPAPIACIVDFDHDGVTLWDCPCWDCHSIRMHDAWLTDTER